MGFTPLVYRPRKPMNRIPLLLLLLLFPHTTCLSLSGSYSDGNHPNCLRLVKVLGKHAVVSGTDGDPGCPADGSGDAWNLLATVAGDTITVDFSPKGGPEDLTGVLEESPVVGIRWEDGNLWVKKGDVHVDLV